MKSTTSKPALRRSQFIADIIATAHHSKDQSRFGFREAVLVMMLVFGTVTAMRFVLVFLNQGIG
jgi:hypothetical protein